MTLKETIRRLNPDEEVYTPERCFIVDLGNDDWLLDARPNRSCGRCR